MEGTSKRNIFTVELITIIVATIVILAVLIPTIITIGNQNSEIADLTTKLESLEAPEGVTAQEVEELLNSALTDLEIPEAGLNEEQIQAIIDTAIQGIKIPAGLTSSQVKAIVADALKDIDTGLSKEEIEAIINNALANQPTVPEDPTEAPTVPADPAIDSADALKDVLAADPLTGALSAGDYNVTLGANINWNAEAPAVVIGEGAKVVIDLNGKQLSTATIFKVDGGSLEIMNGNLTTTGYIQVKDGMFTAEDATMNLNSVLGLGVQNYTANGVIAVKNCQIAALGGETISYAVSNVAGGKMTVENTIIVSDKAVGINNGNGGELTLTDVKMTGTKVCLMTNDAATVVNGGELNATDNGVMTVSAVSGTTKLNGVAICVPEGSTGVISGSAVSGTYTINGK